MANMALDGVKSVLCSGLWTWSPDRKCTIKFNEDGTGDLICGVEFTLFIASEFDWGLLSSAGDIVTESSAEAGITMTLTKRDPKHHSRRIKHTALTDMAFEQKVYQVRLEKGAFKVEGRTTYGHNPTYVYRLLWNNSPYPPLEEWNKKAPARAGKYWERCDFYKDEMKETAA